MKALRSRKYKTWSDTNEVSYRVKIDFELSKEEYENLLTHVVPKPQQIRNVLSQMELGKITDFVCKFFGVTQEEMLTRTRKRMYVLPRQCAMYLAKENIDTSLNNIGQQLGGRDHATVLHAWKKIMNMEHGNSEDQSIFNQLTAAFNEALKKKSFDKFDGKKHENADKAFRMIKGKRVLKDEENKIMKNIDSPEPLRRRRPRNKTDHSMLGNKPSREIGDGW